MTESHRRPYKVWSCDRQTRKAVVVTTLQDLKQRGGERLGYSGSADVTVVLEIDGTEVEDENYFQTLVKDTIFLLLRPNEKWLPPGVEALRAEHRGDNVDGSERIAFSKDPVELITSLKNDVAGIVLLNEEQLEIISKADIPEQTEYSERQRWKLLQESCDRILIAKQDAHLAKEFLGHLREGNRDEVDSQPGLSNSRNLLNFLTEARRLFRPSVVRRSTRARISKRTKPY